MLVLLALGSWQAAGSSRVQWRASVLLLKLQGSLPAASWTQVVHLMLPGRLRDAVGNLRYASLLPVKASQRGPEPCPVLWETPAGGFWGRSSDAEVLGLVLVEQLLCKIYERGPVVIRAGDVVFDAGAHLGTFSRFALKRGARLVVAFEPEPTNIACYKQTFKTEIAQGRVVLVEAALWEAPGMLSFTDSSAENSGDGWVQPIEGSLGNGVHDPINNGDPTGSKALTIQVPATTLDDTVARLGLQQLDFIKMDIEGSERYALRGARQALRRFHPRAVVCIYHKQDDPVVVPDTVLGITSTYRMFRDRGQVFFY